MGAGIDYSMGTANFNPNTGIHFGVISQNVVLQAWADSSEADYPSPIDTNDFECPKCREVYFPTEKDDWGDTVECKECGEEFELEDMDLEPYGFVLDDGEYKASCGEDGDIFILRSPYFTYCQFCSPCAPGAGYLMNPFVNEWVNSGTGERGVNSAEDYPEDYKIKAHYAGFPKTYCFGHDWFYEGKAPYPVYLVDTGELVNSEEVIDTTGKGQ